MSAGGEPLTLGFMPLLDAALPVVAAVKGFAAEEGLSLRLVRETSWANIRDRLSIGHFDAAQLLGPMVVAQAVGIAPLSEPLLAPLALGRGGNAITVSGALWARLREAGAGIGDPPALMAAALQRVIRQRESAQLAPLTFAVVFPFSSHHYQVCEWLSSAGIDPQRDVRLVVLPPPLLVDALRTGQVDGFCAGEPWGSAAVEADIGVLAVAISDLWPNAPEKVLALRTSFAATHPGRVAALVRALAKAAGWAGQAANHRELASLLAEPRHVGVPAEWMRRVLEGRIRREPGGALVERRDFIALDTAATEPLPADAEWHFRQMQRCGQLPAGDAKLGLALASFRPDLYRAALRAVPAKATD